MLLAGKNAVVTGCLRGIGRQTLVTLAEHGASVWACAQAPDPEFEPVSIMWVAPWLRAQVLGSLVKPSGTVQLRTTTSLSLRKA